MSSLLPLNTYYRSNDLFLVGGKPPSAREDKLKPSPGNFVATGSRDKSIRIWDSGSGQCLKVLVSFLFFLTVVWYSGKLTPILLFGLHRTDVSCLSRKFRLLIVDTKTDFFV